MTLTWNCSDALSGPVTDRVSQSLIAEGAGFVSAGSCADRAGHTASDTQSGINIDKTSPATQIVSPADGAAYELNAPVVSAYSCADALSGVSACAGPVASGVAVNTATIGSQVFTVNATDAAGNSSAATHSYSVRYGFSGFLNPVASLPSINSANAGRTVPIRYTLRDANGSLIEALASFTSLTSAPIACGSSAPAAEAEEIDAAGNAAIRFDVDKFVFNWKTMAAWQGTCRVLRLSLADGTQHSVMFQFR